MPPETLHIVTLSICIFTLILAAAALMPQLKRAMVLVRDATLMTGMVIVLSFAGFVGWGKVFELREQRKQEVIQPVESFNITDLFEPSNSDHEELDPLPLPTIDDEQPLQKQVQGHSQFNPKRGTAAMQASAGSHWGDADRRGWEQ